MRYAVLSDTHGNLEALEAVLEEVEKQGYDKMIFLGDFVGYGPNPNECVELLREKVDLAVLGNHDAAVLNPKEAETFNEYARRAVEWTREVLTEENKKYLASLPLIVKPEENIVAVHSTPYKPERWEYILSSFDADYFFERYNEWIALIGHSHVPGAFILVGEENIKEVEDVPLELREEYRYMINPGSVGQPRDYDWRASFGILDLEKKTFDFFRVKYDVEKTQRKIIQAGLPEVLAERLAIGF